MAGDRQGKSKIPKTLPPSDDKEFWGDAEVIKVTIREAKPKCSKFVQKGNVVYCLSCPNPHVIPNAYLDEKGRLKKS